MKRNHGLMLSTCRIEVQDVNPRHRTPCAVCNKMPTGRRLHVKHGSGRAQKIEIRCQGHGDDYLEAFRNTVLRARRRLAGEDLCVRE